MVKQFRRLAGDQRGTSIVEHAIVLCWLSIGAYLAFLALMGAITNFSDRRSATLLSASTTAISTLPILSHYTNPNYQP